MKISHKQLIEEIKKERYASQIAKKYNLSESAISQRVKRLEKKGILKTAIRTSYNQVEITGKQLKFFTKARNGRESANRPTKLTFEPHKLSVKFPLLSNLQLKKVKPLFPIKKPLKNWTAYYSLDKSIKLTTKNIFFYIKLDVLEQDSNKAEAMAIAKATKKALELNQQQGMRINILKPEIKQEIRIKHPLINKLFKDKKRQVYWKGGKKVYHGDKTCIEVYDKESAERVGQNLSLIDTRTDILEAINKQTEAIQNQTGVMEIFATGMKEHMILIKKLQEVVEGLKSVKSETK